MKWVLLQYRKRKKSLSHEAIIILQQCINCKNKRNNSKARQFNFEGVGHHAEKIGLCSGPRSVLPMPGPTGSECGLCPEGIMGVLVSYNYIMVDTKCIIHSTVERML